MPPASPFFVRQYAHVNDPAKAVRDDFTETVYWHPVLVVPDNGRLGVSFHLNDDVARYRILVAGHTADGRLGAITETIEARKPFTVEPELPLEVTSSDTLMVPIKVTNDSDERRTVSYTLHATGMKLLNSEAITMPDGSFKDTIDLQPRTSGRKFYKFQPTMPKGTAKLRVVGTSEPAAPADAVEREVAVVPEGFPVVGAFSDVLEKKAVGTITLPKDVLPGTLKVALSVYPTTMADLIKGLDGLIREPGGCFEQTSTNNYPNTLILELPGGDQPGEPARWPSGRAPCSTRATRG